MEERLKNLDKSGVWKCVWKEWLIKRKKELILPFFIKIKKEGKDFEI